MIDLDALEALCALTTQGPWEAGVTVIGTYRVTAPQGTTVVSGFENDDDAIFIVAAHRAIPELIAEVRRLRNALAACQYGAAERLATRMRLLETVAKSAYAVLHYGSSASKDELRKALAALEECK